MSKSTVGWTRCHKHRAFPPAANGCDVTSLSSLDATVTKSAMDGSGSAGDADAFISDGLPGGAGIVLECADAGTFFAPHPTATDTLEFDCFSAGGVHTLDPALPDPLPSGCVAQVECATAPPAEDTATTEITSDYVASNTYQNNDVVRWVVEPRRDRPTPNESFGVSK